MRNYRTIDETAPFNDQSGLSTTPTGAVQVDPWQQTMNDYDAEVQADSSFAGPEQNTIEEEFNTYIMSIPKRTVAIDTIKFWEVRYYLAVIQDSDIHP
jgi:hypothetical protein